MKVLILSAGQDTGGQGARIAAAFRRHAGWDVRAMHASKSFIKFPSDLEWDEQEARRLYDAADVVHHKNGLIYYRLLDDGQRKPTVAHHQGTRLRRDPEGVCDEGESIGALQLASTVDLLADCPGATWLPSPYELDELAARYPRRKNRRLRIGHAPTNRKAKGTTEILRALDSLARRHDIDVDLIEGMRWDVCLSRKSRCDIFVDQITIGYGNNSVEAMAFGIPVVSGWAEPADRQRFIEQAGISPQFYEATAENIERRLEEMITSEDLRHEWGKRGRAYAELVHSADVVVHKLKEIYLGTPKSLGAEHLRLFGEKATVAA